MTDAAPTDSGATSVASAAALGVALLAVAVLVGVLAVGSGPPGATSAPTTPSEPGVAVESVSGNRTVTVAYTNASGQRRSFAVDGVDPARSDADHGWAILDRSALPSALKDVDDAAAGVVEFGEWALVGRMRAATVSIDGARLRVVSPAGRDVDPRRKAGFLAEFLSPYSLAPNAASQSVTIVSVPRSMGSRGLMYPDDTGYVTRQAFWDGDVESVWIHEFVHARQDFRLTAEMDWFTEASAEYLSYRVMEEQYEEVSEADVRARFESIGAYVGTELANHSTWRGSDADYHKGASLLYAVDSEIRAGSDGEHTLIDAFRAMNERERPVSVDAFVRIVERLSGEDEDWIRAAITDSRALDESLSRADSSVFTD